MLIIVFNLISHVLKDNGHCTQHWLMFDRILQQIVLQMEGRPRSDVDADDNKCDRIGVSSSLLFHDPDISPLDINVAEIVQLLVKEEELTQARKRADELEKENFDVQSRLAKKEQEYDQRTQEKEDLETSLARMRERLEKESNHHSQAMQRAQLAEIKVEDLQHQLVNEQQERTRLERLVTEGSIPDDQKMAGLAGCAANIAASHLNSSQSNRDCSVNNRSVIPPPPPPMASAPPPPPPPCPGPPPPPAMTIATGKSTSQQIY